MNGAAWLVVLLILLCVGYPVYTGNLNQPLIALVANGVVIVIAALAAWRAGERRGWVRRSSCRSSRGYRWPRWRSVR
jgi:hypothetical protein